MNKASAQTVQKHILQAMEELTAALFAAEDGATPEGYATLKKGIGLALGHIQMEILEPIYAEHPELDHHKK